MEARRSVLLVDDHPLVGEGLTALISREPDLAISASVHTLAAARVSLTHHLPDLVLTDLTLPDGSGLEFVKDLRAIHPGLAILVLSMHDETLYAERAIHAGANGYLMKETPAAELLRTIRAVFEGGRHVSAKMSSNLLARMGGLSGISPTSPLQRLSDRELQVFECIGLGKASGEIALALGLSTRTVEGHRLQLRKKLNLSESHGLEYRAIRWVEHGESTW